MRTCFCNYTEKVSWENAKSYYIDQFPWKNSQRSYTPVTQFRLLHNKKELIIRFDVWEKNIRATYCLPNDPVCRDSCVEFFFRPHELDQRYFSFEINPLGSLLIGLGTSGNDIKYLTDDRKQFHIQTIAKANYWQALYKIPFAFINKYFAGISLNMKGNFMKCADLSETPHYGCWNYIDTAVPMFHVPRCFGNIKLTKNEALQ